MVSSSLNLYKFQAPDFSQPVLDSSNKYIERSEAYTFPKKSVLIRLDFAPYYTFSETPDRRYTSFFTQIL